jgi:hypothetical protein
VTIGVISRSASDACPEGYRGKAIPSLEAETASRRFPPDRCRSQTLLTPRGDMTRECHWWRSAPSLVPGPQRTPLRKQPVLPGANSVRNLNVWLRLIAAQARQIVTIDQDLPFSADLHHLTD